MSTRPAVLAAASPWVRDRLAGERREGSIVHAGPQAVYLTVDDTVLAVVARDGVRVPCGAFTTLGTLTDLDGTGSLPVAGNGARIGGGSLHIGAAEIRIGRLVDTRAPRIDPADSPELRARLSPPDLGGELPVGALDALRAADPSSVERLLGLGSGLTPLGDDVLCGWLATMVAAAHRCGEPVAARVLELAPDRTTALSTTLLRRAVEGEVLPQFARVVRQLQAPSTATEPAQSVAALAGVGHTSGAGMLLGLTLALDHLASRSCP